MLLRGIPPREIPTGICMCQKLHTEAVAARGFFSLGPYLYASRIGLVGNRHATTMHRDIGGRPQFVFQIDC